MSNDPDASPENQEISDGGVADKVPFLVKAANLPASNITPVEVPFEEGSLKLLVKEPSILGLLLF